MEKNDLIKKGKANLKICSVLTWETKYCNTHIAEYLDI